VSTKFVIELSNYKEIVVDETVTQRFNRPAEKLSYERYRKIFINDSRVKDGIIFYNEKKALLDTISSYYGVDPFLLVSLSGVESNYGSNSKTHSVFNALHTVIHNLPRRAKWVEKEMAEYLIYCWENEISPLSLYGSYAGAFGYGQFIPSSFRAYAVDFDRDGVREPFEWPDVLASMANYLVKNGYSSGENNFSKDSPNWKSIFRYNPSENYVNVILDLRIQLMEVAN
jgi:membrane-bound lytic murein transglycosylase B